MIPERTLTRAPSAELRADQTDQDSLPPYEVLDRIIELYMQEGLAISDIIAAGLDEPVVRRVVRMIRIAEYKRRQSPRRHPRHAPRLRPRLALSDHQPLSRGERVSGRRT